MPSPRKGNCCAKGHTLAGDNVIFEKRRRKDGSTTQFRRCRTCLNRRLDRASERRRSSRRQPDAEPVKKEQPWVVCRTGKHHMRPDDVLLLNGKRVCPDCR